MRSQNRLYDFYRNITEIHKNTFPDWRFFQLMSNFMGWVISKKKRDPFYLEEEVLKLFREYANTTSLWKRDN